MERSGRVLNNSCAGGGSTDILGNRPIDELPKQVALNGFACHAGDQHIRTLVRRECSKLDQVGGVERKLFQLQTYLKTLPREELERMASHQQRHLRSNLSTPLDVSQITTRGCNGYLKTSSNHAHIGGVESPDIIKSEKCVAQKKRDLNDLMERLDSLNSELALIRERKKGDGSPSYYKPRGDVDNEVTGGVEYLKEIYKEKDKIFQVQEAKISHHQRFLFDLQNDLSSIIKQLEVTSRHVYLHDDGPRTVLGHVSSGQKTPYDFSSPTTNTPSYTPSITTSSSIKTVSLTSPTSPKLEYALIIRGKSFTPSPNIPLPKDNIAITSTPTSTTTTTNVPRYGSIRLDGLLAGTAIPWHPPASGGLNFSAYVPSQGRGPALSANESGEGPVGHIYARISRQPAPPSASPDYPKNSFGMGSSPDTEKYSSNAISSRTPTFGQKSSNREQPSNHVSQGFLGNASVGNKDAISRACYHSSPPTAITATVYGISGGVARDDSYGYDVMDGPDVSNPDGSSIRNGSLPLADKSLENGSKGNTSSFATPSAAYHTTAYDKIFVSIPRPSVSLHHRSHRLDAFDSGLNKVESRQSSGYSVDKSPSDHVTAGSLGTGGNFNSTFLSKLEKLHCNPHSLKSLRRRHSYAEPLLTDDGTAHEPDDNYVEVEGINDKSHRTTRNDDMGLYEHGLSFKSGGGPDELSSVPQMVGRQNLVKGLGGKANTVVPNGCAYKISDSPYDPELLGRLTRDGAVFQTASKGSHHVTPEGVECLGDRWSPPISPTISPTLVKAEQPEHHGPDAPFQTTTSDLFEDSLTRDCDRDALSKGVERGSSSESPSSPLNDSSNYRGGSGRTDNLTVPHDPLDPNFPGSGLSRHHFTYLSSHLGSPRDHTGSSPLYYVGPCEEYYNDMDTFVPTSIGGPTESLSAEKPLEDCNDNDMPYSHFSGGRSRDTEEQANGTADIGPEGPYEHLLPEGGQTAPFFYETLSPKIDPVNSKGIIRDTARAGLRSCLKKIRKLRPHPLLPDSGKEDYDRRVRFDPLALLLDAALEGELDMVMESANKTSDPSASNDEGITALHNAICAGHYDIVKFLVDFGCDINAQDSDGWTPLHCAASCNNFPMIKFLVEHGASVFATTVSDRETPLEKCEEDEYDYEQCASYLYQVQESTGIANSGKVYALYNFDAKEIDELNFGLGEVLTITNHDDDDNWWKASNSEGESGLIPKNYIGLYQRVDIDSFKDG